jgi:hypothetical protein
MVGGEGITQARSDSFSTETKSAIKEVSTKIDDLAKKFGLFPVTYAPLSHAP